jgi:hypothetical protein
MLRKPGREKVNIHKLYLWLKLKVILKTCPSGLEFGMKLLKSF